MYVEELPCSEQNMYGDKLVDFGRGERTGGGVTLERFVSLVTS